MEPEQEEIAYSKPSTPTNMTVITNITAQVVENPTPEDEEGAGELTQLQVEDLDESPLDPNYHNHLTQSQNNDSENQLFDSSRIAQPIFILDVNIGSNSQ